jgi:hypothetical protein
MKYNTFTIEQWFAVRAGFEDFEMVPITTKDYSTLLYIIYW